MRNDNRKAEIIAFAVFVVPLIYMGLKIAPYMSNGLISILNNFGEIFAQPFKITLCRGQFKSCPHFAFNLRYYFVGVFFFKEKLQAW